ncbi:MAG: hypothetical protein ACKVOH_00670 [Chlamydiales bacterium]
MWLSCDCRATKMEKMNVARVWAEQVERSTVGGALHTLAPDMHRLTERAVAVATACILLSCTSWQDDGEEEKMRVIAKLQTEGELMRKMSLLFPHLIRITQLAGELREEAITYFTEEYVHFHPRDRANLFHTLSCSLSQERAAEFRKTLGINLEWYV